MHWALHQLQYGALDGFRALHLFYRSVSAASTVCTAHVVPRFARKSSQGERLEEIYIGFFTGQ